MLSAPDLVVLSPHLDDAVLSVGSLLAARARSGASVEVVTVFTRAPDPARVPRRLSAFADYSARAAEDARALDRLGVRRRHLDLPERVWRDPASTGLREAFRTPARVEGFTMLGPVREAIEEIVDRGTGQVLVPLGIGHHADHVEAALATLQVLEEHRHRIRFYEDFYALGERARRRHPVTGPRCRSWPGRLAGSPGWAAPFEGIVLWATTYLGSGPRLDDYLPTIRTLPWRAEVQPVSPDDEELQLAAVAEYVSQVPALGGIRRLSAILRRAHRIRGGEILWAVDAG